MAYPLSESAKNLFRESQLQIVEITGLDIEVTDADIETGGLTIDRYSVTGSQIELGSVVAAELSLTLDNSNGKFDTVEFAGQELYVKIGIKDWSDPESVITYLPMGYFTVDESPRRLAQINLVALDRMVQFDKTVVAGQLTFPSTVGNLIQQVCTICNVPLKSGVVNLPNSNYQVISYPEAQDLTYRQVLSWLAEMTGTCAFIDWTGGLVLKWYDWAGTTIGPAERFNSDLEEEAITITGVQIESGEVVALAGTDDYALLIQDNALIQSDHNSIANEIASVVNGLQYTPFTAIVKPMPWLYPLDTIIFTDLSGGIHETVVTNTLYKINDNTSLSGKGESSTKKGYAQANPLTKREAAIIGKIERETNATLSEHYQATLRLNELITNSLGYYDTTVTNEDGSKTHYKHDQPNLEDSMVIYTTTANGHAWTELGWNDGNPVWTYGVTSEGSMVMRTIRTEGLSADWINAGKIDTNLILVGDQTLEQALGSISQQVEQLTGGGTNFLQNSNFGTYDNPSGYWWGFVTAQHVDLRQIPASAFDARNITASQFDNYNF